MDKKYAIQLSIIAVILSLVALGATLFQNWNKQWDSVMFALAMLSAIVVVLMGWQIVTVASIKNSVRKQIEGELESIRSEIDKGLQENKKQIEEGLIYSQRQIEIKSAEDTGVLFYNIADAITNTNDGAAIVLYIKAIYNLSFTQYNDMIPRCIDRVLSIMDSYSSEVAIDIPASEANKYIEMLNRVDDDRIYRIVALLLRS